MPNQKHLRPRICLVLVACLLLSMVPFGALAATGEVSITGIDTGVRFETVACNNSGSSKSFSCTCENGRIANEIASADGKITVKIDPSQVSEAILAPV